MFYSASRTLRSGRLRERTTWHKRARRYLRWDSEIGLQNKNPFLGLMRFENEPLAWENGIEEEEEEGMERGATLLLVCLCVTRGSMVF